MIEEFWTKRDGTKIAVGDMDIDHLRNTLRMLIRNQRKQKVITKYLDDTAFGPFDDMDCQDMLNAQSYRDLANPNIYFPLLGVHGSPELQKSHGGKL